VAPHQWEDVADTIDLKAPGIQVFKPLSFEPSGFQGPETVSCKKVFLFLDVQKKPACFWMIGQKACFFLL